MTFAGISYSLSSGDNNALFTIDPDSGIVSYIAIPTATELTHNITVVATDKGGNTDTLKVRIAVISRATVVSVSAADGFYTDDDILSVTVKFSEAVTSPTYRNWSDYHTNTGVTGVATYTVVTTRTFLTFTYTVDANDNTRDLRYTNTGSLIVNTGAAIRTRNDSLDANLTLPEPGSLNSLSGSSNVVLDNTAPVFPDTGTATNARSQSRPTDPPARCNDANATDRGRTADTGISYTWAHRYGLLFA